MLGQICRDILSIRIDSEKLLSVSHLNNHYLESEDIKIKIIAPVCTDHSFEISASGSYKYTFESVGSCIGLAASKAIKGLKHLKSMVEDCPTIVGMIQIKILIGDFEARQSNLKALNLSLEEFISCIDGSVDAFSKASGYSCSRFTSVCGGLEKWKKMEKALRLFHDLNNFESLVENHNEFDSAKRLISRIPLYRRWFGEQKD